MCLTHLPIVVVTDRECLCVSDTFAHCCGYRQGMSVCLTHLPIVVVTGRECLGVSDTFVHCCGYRQEMSVDVWFSSVHSSSIYSGKPVSHKFPQHCL